MGLLTLYDVRVGHLLIRANVSLAIASNNDERIVKQERYYLETASGFESNRYETVKKCHTVIDSYNHTSILSFLEQSNADEEALRIISNQSKQYKDIST